MGLFGGDSRNYTTTTNREHINNNTGDGNQFAFGDVGGNVQVSALDGGAIEQAFDFASQQSAGVSDTLKEVTSLAVSALDNASNVASPVNINSVVKYSAFAVAVVFAFKFGFKQ